MQVRFISGFAMGIATVALAASPSEGAVVMNEGFSSPTFDNGANYSTLSPSGTVDDTANGGGIWKSTKPSIWTATGWGKPNPGANGGMNVQGGGVVNGDIGTAISTGTVTVTMDLKRENRGGIIGGRATEKLTNLAGSATDMLFGVIWEHNAVYNIDPSGYYGAQSASVPSSNNTWNTITFALDFSTDTYSVSIGETGTVWTNLPMNTTGGNDSLKYIYMESIVAQNGSVYYDNVVVDHVVPEPAALGLLGLGGLLAGRRRYSGR